MRKTWITLVATGVVMAGLAVASPSAVADTSTQTTYTATVTIPVPPASDYSGSAGGDGWALALSPTQVFNVFHHAGTMQVACHLQSDASPCWTPRTVTDASGNGFATSGHPGLWLDQTSSKLYDYGTRTVDATVGVVCIDTVAAATSTDPFCGFTPLSAVGEGPLAGGISAVSNGVVLGSRFWAFNFVSGAAVTGSRNTLLCFDTTTLAACASQPYSLGLGGGTMAVGSFPPPSIAPIADRIVVPVALDGTAELGCWDTATAAPCTGSWPVALPAAYAVSGNGAPFPLLSAAGAITGLCLPDGTDECFSLTGATVATPAGLAGAVSATSGWNGPAFVLGARVYVPNGNTDAVECYDASTSATCAQFPKALSDLELLYTVNPDPQRPECIWVNADGGSSQIQNFDAFTGAGCGAGAIRVLGASVVVPTTVCEPASWTSLTVVSPARADYASGSVHFEDGNANPVPGLADAALDAGGAVDLSPLHLDTVNGLPQFLITLTGQVGGRPTSLTVQLQWTGTADPSCLKPGTTASGPPATTPPPGSTAPTPQSNGPELAVTGGKAAALALLGLMLLVTGTATMLVTARASRRERRPRHG